MLSTILFDPRLTPAAAALLGALIGVTGTLFVTIVNGLIGRNRYRREKIWERRQEACGAIVGSLRAAKPWADRISEGFAEDEHYYYGSDALKAEHDGYLKVIGRADEAFKESYLILPTHFRARYERLTAARHRWDFDAGPDVYLGLIAENDRATRDLMDISLSSLGIIPWWHRMAILFRMTCDKITHSWRKSTTKLKRRWKRLRGSSNEDGFDI